MANNKSRVLFLLDWLQENTDEECAVSGAELRQKFKEKDMNATPATLRDDIAMLREAGYDIEVREEPGVATWYKYLDREWSGSEVQILIDAVASSLFITKEKSRQLIDRLAKLAGPSERAQLKPGIRVEDQMKAQNEFVLYTIQKIREAIEKDCRIRFKYFEYTPDLERIPKHKGYVYEVSPYATIWKQDRYYLIGWSEKHGGIINFRIDRMEVPQLTAEARRPAPPDLKLEDNSDKIFWMFDGPEEEVTLRFRPELMNQITDRFGTEVKIENKKAKSMEVTVKVHLSPTFYAWLFQYVGEMTVISPEHVVSQYAERLGHALDDVLGTEPPPLPVDPSGLKEKTQEQIFNL